MRYQYEKILKDLIKEEKDRLQSRMRSALRFPDNRIAIFELVREDAVLFFENFSVSGSTNDDRFFVTQLFNYGYLDSLSLFWNEDLNKPGCPLYPSTKESTKWANWVIQTSGRIRLAEYYHHLIKLGLFEPINVDHDRIKIRIANHDIEAIEEEDLRYIKKKHETSLEELRKALTLERTELSSKMSQLVWKWKDHFIGYNTDTEIDELFIIHAPVYLAHTNGWDIFPPNTSFGGVPFLRYLDAIVAVASFALKHIYFSILLLKKEPSLNLRDLLTMPLTIERAIDFISSAIDADINTSETIFRNLLLDNDNIKYHSSIPRYPTPPYVTIGENFCLMSIAGCLDDPVMFLLNELRRKYPRDWDCAVDSREQTFRRDLYSLFSSFDSIVCYNKNLNIVTGKGEKTDIDALLVDTQKGIAALFQLKWQDLFGSDLNKRESQKRNLLEKTNKWIRKIFNWLDDGRLEDTLIASGLSKEISNNVKTFYVFLLGRSSSNFSGEFTRDSRAAWGNWYQLQRIWETAKTSSNPIKTIYDCFKKEEARQESERGSNFIKEFQVGDLKFIFDNSLNIKSDTTNQR